jgi:hypothetical protein
MREKLNEDTKGPLIRASGFQYNDPHCHEGAAKGKALASVFHRTFEEESIPIKAENRFRRRTGPLFSGLGLWFLLLLLPWNASAYDGAGSAALMAMGALTGYVIHEASHVVVAESLGHHADLTIRNGFPFLVITYDYEQVQLPDGTFVYFDPEGNVISHGARDRYLIASAGLFSQAVTSEVLLSRYPHLRGEERPYVKGIFFFDTLTVFAYALFGRDDSESDIRGMAESLGISRELAALMVSVPAALDLYRYYYPDQPWAVWSSRLGKGLIVGLAFSF